MLAYIIRRLIYLIPVLFVLTVVVFAFVQMLPGDIIDVMMGEEDIEDPEVRIALEKEFGLNEPIYVQYGKWISRVLQGDLGKSLITRRDVTLELLERIPATAYLAITGMILSICIAIPLGTLAALKRNTYVDNAIQISALARAIIDLSPCRPAQNRFLNGRRKVFDAAAFTIVSSFFHLIGLRFSDVASNLLVYD